MNSRIVDTIFKFSPYLLILIAFFINFGWHISDHDDGHTLAYHAFGRNPEIQHLYGLYDSMCDFLLALLPQDFHYVFGSMIIVTVICSMAVIYLMSLITKNITKIDNKSIHIASLLFLVAMPDFLYLSFTFKSIIISFFFLLFSFYLIIKELQKEKISYLMLLLSAAVFGFGVSLRWNNLTFGLIPTVYILYTIFNTTNKFIKAFIISGIWGFAAMTFSILFIWASGFSPEIILKIIRWGTSYIENANFPTTVRIIDILFFITPASSLILVAGLYFLIARYKLYTLVIILFLATLASFTFLGFVPNFKYLITLWPILFILFAVTVYHFRGLTLKNKSLIRILFVIILLFPWFVGVQINAESTNWGPGFDIKTRSEKPLNNTHLDKRANFQKLRPGFFSGIALPTSEGVRPLYGNFYAIYGGDLKQFDIKLNKYADDVIQHARGTGAIIFVDREHPYLQASLFKNEFTTNDPYSQGAITDRVYFTANGDSIKEMRFVNPKKMFNIDSIYNHTSNRNYVAYFTTTSELNKLEFLLSEDGRFVTQRIGPFTCLFDKK